jgi:hypothetical protein
LRKLDLSGVSNDIFKHQDRLFSLILALCFLLIHEATPSRNNKLFTLVKWCSHARLLSYKAIKDGRKPSSKLSKADIQRLENAGSGFEWSFF